MLLYYPTTLHEKAEALLINSKQVFAPGQHLIIQSGILNDDLEGHFSAAQSDAASAERIQRR